MTTHTYRLTVKGMTCGHCEKAVTRAIRQVDGGAEVSIDREANLVQVQPVADAASVCGAIREEGYQVEDNCHD